MSVLVVSLHLHFYMLIRVFHHQRGTPFKLTFEATNNLDGNVETFHVDTTINLGDHLQLSIPEQASVIPPEVPQVKSNMEEVRTSGITTNISDMDVNVNKGDGVSISQAKEVAKVDQNYSSIHTKVDIVVDAFTKLAEYHTSLNSKEFVHLQGVLAEVKEMISKLAIPPTSTVSQESISQLFSESQLKAGLDPLLQLVNLMPMAAPPVSTGVQGGDKGVIVTRVRVIFESLRYFTL
ncbi:unnamed protein product [Lactuca saligna]|uniref:Uncharacterized protein n=1 Tax=Lactuca saligna TaxID=75948 RepID=A0AA35YXB0_LACSI|nr:unnamed protein product [Lactuca saligna]